MNIYSYLKKDHTKVSELFKKIIAAKDSTKCKYYYETIKEELELHADSEDATFYKELRKHKETKDKVQHAKKEHKEIKSAISKIDKFNVKSHAWFIHLGELKSIVDHHVKEEEGEIFKAAKKVISNKKAKELAEKMDELKKEMKPEKSSIVTKIRNLM